MQGWIRAQDSTVFFRYYRRVELAVCCGESVLWDTNWMFRNRMLH